MSPRALRRAFLAVMPPPAVLDAISGCVAHLGEEGSATHPGLRWTTREQWHITLQFLGRVGDVEGVVDVVGDALRSVRAGAVRLGGGGAFPRPASASVLWLGVVGGQELLTAIAACVNRATATLGFEPEDRFRPHVTLARARKRRDVRPVIDELGSVPIGPEWPVREVVLLESDTHPEGARYSLISRMRVEE